MMPTNSEYATEVKSLKAKLQEKDKEKQSALEDLDRQYEQHLKGKEEEIKHLKGRVRDLQENPAEYGPQDEDAFCNKVWEVAFSSSIQALYNRNIPVTGDTKQVSYHMQTALKVSDQARTEAKKYMDDCKLKEKEVGTDPLIGMLGTQN